MKHKQKDTFIASEGDAWFDRNHEAISRRNYDESDPIIQAVDHSLENGVKDAGGGADTT